LHANPTGGEIVHGSLNFSGLGTSSLTVNQASNLAIINWQDFSIGVGEITRFVQPSVSSLAINRVITGNPTAIYGQLSANGGVMVINPNGIMVGASGTIDVGGLLTLSTLDASNSDLLSGGSMRFSGNGGAGVVNYGNISARDAVLMGNYVDNQGNIIGARSAILAAGGDMILGQTPSGATISVRGGGSGVTGVNNSGSIVGGAVDMVANGNAYSRAINNSGAVRAKGYNYSGGKLTLSAGNRSGGIINTGNLQARNQDGRGGQINIEGGNVNLASGKVDASGELGRDGGTVAVKAADLTVGSDSLIMADGVAGGTVSLDATGTATLAGTVSSKGSFGDGGKVDLAGNQVNLAATAKVDVSGLNGGQVRAGGGFQGNESDIRNSTTTNVSAGALMIADGNLGDGGKVIVWSDRDTMFGGEVSAQATGGIGNGGFVEVSGKNQLSYMGRVNTSAANGSTGTLLLDPTDVIIGAIGGSGLTLTDAALMTALLQNNLVISTSGSGGNGDISILSGSNIQYDSPNSLTFLAHRHIFVNGDVKNHGTTDTA